MNATIVLLVSLIASGGTVQERKYEMQSIDECTQVTRAAKVAGEGSQQLFCVEISK